MSFVLSFYLEGIMALLREENSRQFTWYTGGFLSEKGAREGNVFFK